MRNNSVFADAFNYFVYGGKQVIKPENLHELDTTEIAIPFGNGDEAAVQKFRDLLKAAVFMADDDMVYLVLGVENEAEVKFAEPVKTGLYDFLQYSKQVQQTAARHREAKDWKGFDEEAEVVDVCKAVQEMNERARLETLCDAVPELSALCVIPGSGSKGGKNVQTDGHFFQSGETQT